MNDWMVPRFEWDDKLPPRPRQGARRRGAREDPEEKFSRYLDVDGDGIAARTLPGVHPEGRLLRRAARATTSTAPVHRGLRRLPGARRPPQAQVRDRGRVVPEPDHQHQPGRRGGLVTIGGCDAAVREAAEMLAPRASTPTTCACAASRSATRCRKFLGATSMTSSSSRTATRSCAAAHPRSSCVARERHAGARLRGMPLTAPGRRHAVINDPSRRRCPHDVHHQAPVKHPSAHQRLGLTRRDYEGAMSTLCAGCGHDSITAAIVQAAWELADRAAPRREDERHRLLVEDPPTS
jgi:hypothetical protein